MSTERHQFGFSFMRWDTGGQRMHTFWGSGANVEACKRDARAKAETYRYKYENELNEKARRKNTSRYAPSPIQVQIVGCSLWR